MEKYMQKYNSSELATLIYKIQMLYIWLPTSTINWYSWDLKMYIFTAKMPQIIIQVSNCTAHDRVNNHGKMKGVAVQVIIEI